jgi:hypothetical protein
LAETAAVIADGERCSQAMATVLARTQALAAMPGQRELASTAPAPAPQAPR